MGSPIRSDRDLIACQKGFQLGVLVYRVVLSLPGFQRFRMISG